MAVLHQQSYPNLFAPPDLTERDQWVAWRRINGKKVPYQVNGTPASVSDPRTWTTYENVCKAKQAGSYDGIAFILTRNDPFVMLDFDDCLDRSGKVKGWADSFVYALAETYIEVSPGGRGLKAFVRGELLRNVPPFKVGDGQVEMYAYSHSFAFTGRRYRGAPFEIEKNQNIINWLFSVARDKEPRRNVRGSTEPVAHLASYLVSIVENECRRIRCAQPGCQNTTLNKAAWTLGQLVGPGYLRRDNARQLLINAASSMQSLVHRKPWTYRDITQVVDQGLNAGMREPRYLKGVR